MQNGFRRAKAACGLLLSHAHSLEPLASGSFVHSLAAEGNAMFGHMEEIFSCMGVLFACSRVCYRFIKWLVKARPVSGSHWP